jgi:hypothetical protein
MSINFSSFQSSKWSQRGQVDREPGIKGGAPHPQIQILADQLTLFRGGGADYPLIDLDIIFEKSILQAIQVVKIKFEIEKINFIQLAILPT